MTAVIEVLDQHRIENIVAGLLDNPSITPGVDGPIFDPKSINASLIRGVRLNDQIQFAFNFVGLVDAAFDPASASRYTFLENPGSPTLHSIALPALNGIAGYEFASYSDGVWSAFGRIAPLDWTLLPDMTTGFAFYAIDTNGAEYDLPEGMIFDLKSNTSGAARAVLTITPTAAGAVPEPKTWALILFGFGAIGGTMRRKRTVSVTYRAYESEL